MANYIVLDTETTNTFDDPMTYDCGWAVINENGEVLAERSFVVADIFLGEKDLMAIAYFADKIPQYIADIADGKRELRRFSTIRKVLAEDYKRYNVVAIMAHNARFDYKACNTTQRYLTSSKYRYFFPYGAEIWDTLKMARQVFGKDADYRKFCFDNGFITKQNAPQMTAEVLYRYLSNNLDFEEEHTGLADVMIEKEIFVECVKRKPNCAKKLWED